MKRIAICPEVAETDTPLLRKIEEDGYQVVQCRDATALLECMASAPPVVVVYFLDQDPEMDLGFLRLVRRTAPQLPLILVASNGSLHFQALTQTLRPVYYTVKPLDQVELSEAIRSAEHRCLAPAWLRRESPSGVNGTRPGK